MRRPQLKQGMTHPTSNPQFRRPGLSPLLDAQSFSHISSVQPVSRATCSFNDISSMQPVSRTTYSLTYFIRVSCFKNYLLFQLYFIRAACFQNYHFEAALSGSVQVRRLLKQPVLFADASSVASENLSSVVLLTCIQGQNGQCACLTRQWPGFNPPEEVGFIFKTSTTRWSTQPHKNGCRPFSEFGWEGKATRRRNGHPLCRGLEHVRTLELYTPTAVAAVGLLLPFIDN